MSRRPIAKVGDYNVICDRSGSKVKASECRMTWEGFFVKESEWEPRHPQDFVRGKRDKQTPPIVRSEPVDYFLSIGEVTPDDL